MASHKPHKSRRKHRKSRRKHKGELVFHFGEERLQELMQCFDRTSPVLYDYYETINGTPNIFESAKGMEEGRIRLLCRTCARWYMCKPCFDEFCGRYTGSRNPPTRKFCSHPKQRHLEVFWVQKDMAREMELEEKIKKDPGNRKLKREYDKQQKVLEEGFAKCKEANHYFDLNLFQTLLQRMGVHAVWRDSSTGQVCDCMDETKLSATALKKHGFTCLE